MGPKLEVCVDNIESATNAFEACVDRIELCSSLSVGGLTPTVGLLKAVKKVNLNATPIFCLIRCRTGNFLYTDLEMEIMIEDAKLLKENGADGFVFGVLSENGGVDLEKATKFVSKFYPLPVTFHRAFDLVTKPLFYIEYLINIGYKRILTSGQKLTALEGVDLIKLLIEKAKNRIEIVPGSGINELTVEKLLAEIPDVKEIHASCLRKPIADKPTSNETAKILENIDLTRTLADEQKKNRDKQNEVDEEAKNVVSAQFGTCMVAQREDIEKILNLLSKPL